MAINTKLPRLHVGNGWHEGALTVFPVWRENLPVDAPAGLRLGAGRVQVSELEGAARVDALVVHNPGPSPVLLVEGELLEGGWQDRVLSQDLLLLAGSSAVAEVCCVEQGRWHGATGHNARGRLAPIHVRSGLRAGTGQRQQQVWARVADYEQRLGATGTSALARHLDRIQSSPALAGVHPIPAQPMPGQSGVVVGVAGRPVSFELFPDPAALAAFWTGLVQAARLDAIGARPVRTPGQRARDLVVAAASGGLHVTDVLGQEWVAQIEGRRGPLHTRGSATATGQVLHLLTTDDTAVQAARTGA